MSHHVGEPGTAQIRAAQIRAAEIHAAQIATTQVHPAQIGMRCESGRRVVVLQAASPSG